MTNDLTINIQDREYGWLLNRNAINEAKMLLGDAKFNSIGNPNLDFFTIQEQMQTLIYVAIKHHAKQTLGLFLTIDEIEDILDDVNEFTSVMTQATELFSKSIQVLDAEEPANKESKLYLA